MSKNTWVQDIIKSINTAISDRSIGKSDLANGLEEIEEHAGEWARLQRKELSDEEE